MIAAVTERSALKPSPIPLGPRRGPTPTTLDPLAARSPHAIGITFQQGENGVAAAYRPGGLREQMIQDTQLTKAVSKIRQRSEKQDDPHKLLGTFVDVGILPQLNNRNSQIFYGRRGTGKTHVLLVLRSELMQEDERNAVAYIDARTLGSSAQFSDSQVPLPRRCLALFQDLLGELHNSLLTHVVEYPSARAEDALRATDELAKLIVAPLKTYREETMTVTSSADEGTSSSRGVSLAADLGSSPHIEAQLSNRRVSDQRNSESITASVRVENEDKVIFPALHRTLSDILQLADSHLYILIDEWSSLPSELQPYLAEFLKRGVLAVQRATLKIASLEHRSHFEKSFNGSLIGFEVGADLAAAQDLDDYYVFDRNPEQIANAYADMLLRHLNSELHDGYLKAQYGIHDGRSLASKLFTERNTFKEMARASEGVVRDLINIFTIAYFIAHRRGRGEIDKQSIIEAARQWFEQDKERQLDDRLHAVLRRIVDEVIGVKKARSFLLPRELERNTTVQRLFDARVLHPMQRGYADKDHPGVRYNIYTLDYGTYVDLRGTSKEPEVDLFGRAEEKADLISSFPSTISEAFAE